MSSSEVTVKRECATVPEFERLSYFYGQMLGAADFRTEQSYFREKLKLHNRCLHGWGVICGLEVTPQPVDPCCKSEREEEQERIERELKEVEEKIGEIKKSLEADDLSDGKAKKLKKHLRQLKARHEELTRELEELPPADDKRPHHHCSARVLLQCGLALDCEGNELIVRQPLLVDLFTSLPPSEKQALKEHGSGTVYLSICYCAEPIHPSRPVLPDSCGAMSDCNYGKYRDSIHLRVSTESPAEEERCEPCCDPCVDHCVLLAAIYWNAEEPLSAGAIDNSVRRPLSLYPPTTITGVSWQHGATYTSDQAKVILGTEEGGSQTDGIEVHFSRPVHAESLAPGVVEFWRIQGGKGLSGVISHVEGKYVDKPDHGLITSVKYRDESGESLNRKDRLLIIIRTDFILDRCCRPVDGNHVGGRVPVLEAYRLDDDENPDRENESPCDLPPGGIGPWTTGNGTAGGRFESWIYIY